MVNEVSFLKNNHEGNSRDYLERVTLDKPNCMDKACLFEDEYWDGHRKFGYGGYKYDGRWKPIAIELIKKYDLNENSQVLDIGCGMAHLLFEIKKLVKCEVVGVDISKYAKNVTLDEIKNDILLHDIAEALPFRDNQFDLAISIMTIHNLELPDLDLAIREIVRVSKRSYVATESYRSNEELFNLQNWALTCRSFFSPRTWEWVLHKNGYLDRELELLYFK